MSRTIRWGILGTGRICRNFTQDLKRVEGAEVAAVGSRTQESAEAYAKDFGIPRAHGSYEALAADPALDVIYIGTPHNLHMENAMLAFEHGKSVLCEKPMAVNLAQLDTMIAAARKGRLFLMEAMWTLFFPALAKAHALVTDGAIGEVRMVIADFCVDFLGRPNLNPRLMRPELAGGALLDLGIYPVSMAQSFMGEPPETITASALLGETGVDIHTDMMLHYGPTRSATLTCSMLGRSSSRAQIVGTQGRLDFPSMFHNPDSVTLVRGEESETFTFDRKGGGMTYEAEAVTRCLQGGQQESPIMPLEFSRQTCAILDAVREQIGLRYPFE